MRVLVLSWEHPPHVVGGLGRHVAALCRAMASTGSEVHVVTRSVAGDDAPSHELLDGVHVHRAGDVPVEMPFGEGFVAEVLRVDLDLQATANRVVADHGPFDVVHAHDWLVGHAAAGLKTTWDLPLVATVHATERGRHQGWLPGPINRLIHQYEWWLTWEARRIVTCSRFMRAQVLDSFGPPAADVDVVPNGVALRDFELPDDEVAAFRRTLAPAGTNVVLFAGRLEYEKGVQTVLDALDDLEDRVGPTVFLVAGVGTYSDELHARVEELGLEDRVRFTGFLHDHELRLHYAAADVAVAPSIYEPFGLVAIEAMACGTPVVVGDTGGLREIVAGGHGLRFTPQDADELADELERVLSDEELATRLVRRGRRRIATRYDWHRVAEATLDVYERAVAEERALRGEPARPPLRPLLRAEPILELDDVG